MDPKAGAEAYSWFRALDPLSSSRHLWSDGGRECGGNGGNGGIGGKAEPNSDQLFVFGYSCKLFRDDQRAEDMDCGQHLIGWNGSSDHLIDRFDVRGYLNDLTQFEPNYKSSADDWTSDELEIERLCDAERFADLRYDDSDQNHDEELKRLHLALADGSTYNQMSYNYDENNVVSTPPTTEPIVCEETPNTDDSNRFKLPSGLSPPEGMALPESQKLQNIIEKTATFVSQHGIQMEIVLKTKQSSNKNFDFLSFDSQLYPYYKYILENIKSGKYIPKQTQNSDNSDSDDSEDEHYLHPSLLGSAKSRESETFNIPNLLRVAKDDDSYSQLVKSFKDRFPSTEEPIETPKPVSEAKPKPKHQFVSISSDLTQNDNNVRDKSCVPNPSQTTWSSLLPSPPPEIEQIIEKLAQNVAKNGEQFELSIRKLGQNRFEFVNPGNIFHALYIRRKLHYLEENRKAQAEQVKLSHKKHNKSDSHTKAPVCFSINPKDCKPSAPIGSTDENLLTIGLSKREDERKDTKPELNAKRISDNALKDKLALAVRERAAKDKQEERKRKAALFLSLIKNKSKEQIKTVEPNQSVSESAFTYGPDLPKPKPNPNSVPLSPTIVAITSPNASPEVHKNSDNESSLLGTVFSSKSYEAAKSGSLLPFIMSDKPMKASVCRLSPHRHKSRRSSGHSKSHKRKRSRSRSRSTSRSHRKHSKHSSKSRSRSRSRSHSRSHKRF